MTAMRVLLVDDEAPARRRLSLMLAEIGGVTVVGAAANGREALAMSETLMPDLVLLDIEMPDLDGIELAAKLVAAGRPPIMIFVTAFDHYAVQAFEHAAIDYLLKPVALERLAAAIARAAATLEARRLGERAQAMAEVIETLRRARPARPPTVDSHVREIWVQRRDERLRIDVADIDWIEAEHDYVQLHLGETSYLLRQRIGELERALDPAMFLRIHRSAIVRRGAVRSIRQGGFGVLAIVLADGRTLRVGRKYAGAVRKMMDRPAIVAG